MMSRLISKNITITKPDRPTVPKRRYVGYCARCRVNRCRHGWRYCRSCARQVGHNLPALPQPRRRLRIRTTSAGLPSLGKRR